MQITKPLIM